MEAPEPNGRARLLRALVAAGVAAAVCFGAVACATVDIDARGYRKYWEPYVSQRHSDANSPSPVPDAQSE